MVGVGSSVFLEVFGAFFWVACFFDTALVTVFVAVAGRQPYVWSLAYAAGSASLPPSTPVPVSPSGSRSLPVANAPNLHRPMSATAALADIGPRCPVDESLRVATDLLPTAAPHGSEDA